ncbi:MAG: hypothetical protein A2W85_00115 [Bacteroidetes bacterium GWF2_41_31]|nr:MAG: hypothetical protein A2W85_00115 [Bacteroidetes bacterium GWF2_41_31]
MNQKNHLSDIIIYQTEDGNTKIETRLEDETVWLTIDQMAELFQKSRSTINEHILNIYEEKELDTEQSMRKIGISDFSGSKLSYFGGQAPLSKVSCYHASCLRQVNLPTSATTLSYYSKATLSKLCAVSESECDT